MRCRCCDRDLRPPEIIWYPAENRHEELCKRCRDIVFDEMRKCGWKVNYNHFPVDVESDESEGTER